MENDSLTAFIFEGEIVIRIVKIGGAPWFVAADVCRALGLTSPGETVRGLDEDEKGLSNVDTLGGKQGLIVVSLSGLFKMALKSRKPDARRFQKWVTGEVLPSIQATGAYIPGAHIIAEQPWMTFTMEEWRVRISAVNAAYRVMGRPGGIWVWEHSGLPMPPPNLLPRWWQPPLIG